MRAAAAVLLALCFTTSANAATVVSVGDGDTVRVSEGSKRVTVRLACIDAPETSQRPWGARSTAFLRQLTPVGSEVTLRVQTADRYGRTVAELLNRRGNVNQLMVEAGQAFAYRRYLRQCDAQKYLQLEADAKQQGRGVWSVGPSGITRPWDYRRGDAAVHQAQAVLESTAARTLALGDRLNSCWLKATVISIVTAMEKPASHSSDVGLERMALRQVSAFVPSTSYPARAVAVVASSRHVI